MSRQVEALIYRQGIGIVIMKVRPTIKNIYIDCLSSLDRFLFILELEAGVESGRVVV